MFYDWHYNGFVPVISIEKYEYFIEKSLEENLYAIVYQWEDIYFENILVLERSIFITNNNIVGSRYFISFDFWSRKMKQIIYIFIKNGKIIAFDITIDPATNEDYISILDKSLKTFQWLEGK